MQSRRHPNKSHISHTKYLPSLYTPPWLLSRLADIDSLFLSSPTAMTRTRVDDIIGVAFALPRKRSRKAATRPRRLGRARTAFAIVEDARGEAVDRRRLRCAAAAAAAAAAARLLLRGRLLVLLERDHKYLIELRIGADLVRHQLSSRSSRRQLQEHRFRELLVLVDEAAGVAIIGRHLAAITTPPPPPPPPIGRCVAWPVISSSVSIADSTFPPMSARIVARTSLSRSGNIAFKESTPPPSLLCGGGCAVFIICGVI